MSKVSDSPCSIERTISVLGERWTFLILRESFGGMSRFADFRKSLGIASDVLADRLSTLVEHGVMEKVRYQEPGERERSAYQLTPAGCELFVVLASLQQWGDRHLPCAHGPILRRCDRRTGDLLHVGFVDDSGREVASNEVAFVPTESYPRERRLLAQRTRSAHADDSSPPGFFNPPRY